MNAIINSPSLVFAIQPKPNILSRPTHCFAPLRFHGLQYRASGSSYNLKATTNDKKSHSTAFLDKDWSVLEQDSKTSNEKIKAVVDAGEIEENSNVVICMGSEEFVDHVCLSSPYKVIALHYSLFVLAGIKEKHDTVRCWQGDIVGLPSSWAPFHVVFINYLPALLCSLDRLFQALVQHCAPGARVIISHFQGRDQINAHKKSNPNIITGDLLAKVELKKILQSYPLQLISFRDDPEFYLAALKGCMAAHNELGGFLDDSHTAGAVAGCADYVHSHTTGPK